MPDRWSTDRLEAFSDGVMAIAITLLVLEIGVPEADFENLWQGIADQWPSYLAYVTSFMTIGGIWLAHHAIFRRLREADATVMRLNLLLLMIVSFLPFPTKLVAEAIDNTSAESAAVVFYGVVLLATSLMVSALMRYITAHHHLLDSAVSDREIVAMERRAAPNLGVYAVVVLLAVVVPQVAALGYLAVAIRLVLGSRGDRRGEAAAES